jgi:hypothetical protein
VLLLVLVVAVVASVGYVRTSLALGREAAQRKLADDEAELAQRRWYAACMNLAQQAWEGDNIPRLRMLLAETKDYPGRGFEWFH